MRANQKDAYFESSLKTQVHDVLHILKGQKFVNSYGNEISVAAKALYLALTTLMGARTLGEEYIDVMYVNRSGKRLPKLLPKIGFILSYAVLPYLVTRVVRHFKPKDEEDVKNADPKKRFFYDLLSSYNQVLDTLMNLHIAVFYFQGEFYSLSKRIFGLRYVFGHNKDPKKLQRTGNYSLLGAIILLEFFFKSLIRFKTYQDNRNKKTEDIATEEKPQSTRIFKIDQLEKLGKKVNDDGKLTRKVTIDLSDPRQLPYLPESSRSCMLCLSPMVNPSAANCGHMFCWECIVDWVRERPECPLCRLQCLEQNLLPLR